MCFQLSASEKSQTLELFTTRRNQYRIAALTCKKHGDIQQAKQFFAVSKVKKRRKSALLNFLKVQMLYYMYTPALCYN